MNKLRKLAERQHGVIAVRQTGLSDDGARHLVDSGSWEYVCRGVLRLVGTRRTHKQMVMAAVLAAGPGAVASHRTAAWLMGVPGFTARGIEVCRPWGKSHRGPIGFIHRSRALLRHHVTVIDGIPCTRVARTLFDLAAILKPGRVERALDNCLGGGLVTFRLVAELLPELATRGRTGTRLMRR